ncbi:hypothetical protein FRB90_008349, partial [Tulasnella sp. 427]
MPTATATTVVATELGHSVPHLPHAISVSLPTWRDTVDYEEGAPRVVDSMKTGYPRFFIHRSIQLLARISERKFALPGERCLLFPTATIAGECRSFIRRHSPTPVTVRLVQYMICPQSSTEKPTLIPPTSPASSKTIIVPSPCQGTPSESVELHIVLFPADTFPLAKSFWQHTGDGISSRMAEKCLEFLGVKPDSDGSPTITVRALATTAGGRYGRTNSAKFPSKNGRKPAAPAAAPAPINLNPVKPTLLEQELDSLTNDHTAYLEERYGRSLPISSYAVAKRALRRRIAGVLLRDSNSPSDPVEPLGAAEAAVGESWRGVKSISEDDVYLHPTGMSAIWHSHQLALGTAEKRTGKSAGKSICFGYVKCPSRLTREDTGHSSVYCSHVSFPYTDTLKILQKWGPGCHFVGTGLDKDLPEVRQIAQETYGSSSPIVALFCEFPSNPLLRSPNLVELRKIADEFNFLIVVDETIGNFVNVDVLKYADVVVSSITKVFSGETNVMGGSLVLNPQCRHYNTLRNHLSSTYEDTYWPEDAVYMERNSRDFRHRIDVINRNAEAIADFLRSQSEAFTCSQISDVAPYSNKRRVIKDVFYPKWVTKENFDACRNRPAPTAAADGEGRGLIYPTGYGGLLSITFSDQLAAQAFFDNLGCEKGPSL